MIRLNQSKLNLNFEEVNVELYEACSTKVLPLIRLDNFYDLVFNQRLICLLVFYLQLVINFSVKID